jgi:hypothetical protein
VTAAAKPKQSAKHQMAQALSDLLADYETLPHADRHAVDIAIVQCLDVSPKDWAIGMRALVERLSK